MLFYLGTHTPAWLWREEANVPLFISRRRLCQYKKWKPSTDRWALDSGGFTELHLHGGWTMPAREYADFVLRAKDDVGKLDWAAPQDWMCEDSALEATGKTLAEHQELTVDNFIELRSMLGGLVIPVLQGREPETYLRHIEMYGSAGFRLVDEPRVGLGSVCRRQASSEIHELVRTMSKQGLKLHGFGVKIRGLRAIRDDLASADSLAWSFAARNEPPLPGCSHKNCNSCLKYALKWREKICPPTQRLLSSTPEDWIQQSFSFT